MLRKVKRLLSLSSCFLLFFSCQKEKIEILKTTKYLYYHPQSTVWIEHRKFSVDEGWVYQNNKLYEIINVDAEGLNKFKINTQLSHRKENLNIEKLKLTRQKDELYFFNKKLKIVKENNDSIISKSAVQDEYYIFIGNISGIK